MFLNTFEPLFHLAKKRGRRRFVIAGAAWEAVLRAVYKACEEGLMDPILMGPSERIQTIAQGIRLDPTLFPIKDLSDESEIAHRAVEWLRKGKADALMKGHISTPILLKAVLDPSIGLRNERLLSHVALLQIPKYHKLLMITDGGMVIRPDLQKKLAILDNAINGMRRLGISQPKVAILAANEKVSEKLSETVDAAEIVRLSKAGRFPGASIEGPMALDMAFDPEAARIKGRPNPVSGDPDILLVPDISCGNILAKALVYLAGAHIAGAIVGAKVPIVLISRAESAESLYRSIALAVVIS